METIQDNGVTFVKATALAKKYRYTTDYIGQLCRGGKVDAKLIGRAWFVNEESLTNHKKDRYGATRPTEIIINKSSVSDRESHPVAVRREVRPVLSKSAHRSILQVAEPKTYNFESRSASRISTYHQDDGLLEPATESFKAKASQYVVPEDDEETRKINVSLGEKASRKLAFEELPEVALRGDLTIASLDDPDLFAEVEPVTTGDIQFVPQSVLKTAAIVQKRYQPRVSRAQMPQVQFEAQLPEEEDFSTAVVTESLPVRKMSQTSQPVVVLTGVRFIVVPVLVSVSILVCGVMLGLASHAESDGLEFRQSLKFSTASVWESVSKISESY